MASNMLKLNEEKTEFIIFKTHQQLKKLQNITIRIGNTNFLPVDHVRNLGFIMDKFCKNIWHINHLSSSLFQQLRNIRNIRAKHDFDTAKIVVQALILSKPDYCNSLLVGTPECHLSRLQCVQNMACRVVCNLRKFGSCVSFNVFITLVKSMGAHYLQNSLHGILLHKRISSRLPRSIYFHQLPTFVP